MMSPVALHWGQGAADRSRNPLPARLRRLLVGVQRAGGGAQFVYALGQLGYDFGTEARRDAFIQAMDEPAAGVRPNPFDPGQLLNYLQKNPWDAASLTWTVSLDGTTVYGVTGGGPFAGEVYLRLRQFLGDQIALQASERASIPGRISGQVRLMNGQVVPVIVPELRGMYSWTTQGLVHAVVGAPLAESASTAEKEQRAKKQEGLREFLDRVYFQLCNLGITAQERAINFAGTNAFNIEKVYESAMKEEMDLDTIEVERSPICRPESDCWHVEAVLLLSGSAGADGAQGLSLHGGRERRGSGNGRAGAVLVRAYREKALGIGIRTVEPTNWRIQHASTQAVGERRARAGYGFARTRGKPKRHQRFLHLPGGRQLCKLPPTRSRDVVHVRMLGRPHTAGVLRELLYVSQVRQSPEQGSNRRGPAMG